MINRTHRAMACSLFAIVAGLACPALAQTAATSADTAAADEGGLEEIIVTAQKREQSLLDVPIAVTALTGEALKVNRVMDVTDLSGLAPGVTVRTAAGGSKLPQFIIRGSFSTGLVPGSDKQVSIYLDGVYISSPRGSIFELPDVTRIEVLRGPQGTLFGRNATSGAVAISTRDPRGEFGVKLAGSIGNYGHYRAQVSLDLPQVGPLSGYVSYVRNYKRGDIRNAGAGQVWDRRGAADPRIAKLFTSPDYLGTKDSDTIFAALKFESGDFTTTYKYDRTTDNGSPEGTGLIGINAGAPLVGPLISALVNSQPTPVNFAADGKRPEVVNNGWATPTIQKVEGHSLTSTLRVSDALSIKNIFAYRKSFLFSTSALDGLSSLTFTQQAVTPYATFIAASTPGFGALSPAAQQAAITQTAAGLQPQVGQPFVGIAQQNLIDSEQISDEIQLNYNSSLVTATAGAIWFRSTDVTGDRLLQSTTSFATVPGGVIPQRGVGYTYNEATSLAAYAQLEVHVTPQLDIVAGARITHDRKAGSFTFGNPPALTTLSFRYENTKPNFLVGVNYKPAEDILLYAKYSTAFVSGGSVAGIPFEPETAASWEAGVKAELFDRRLRAALALYSVTYKHFQVAGSGTNFRNQITALTGNAQLAGSIGSFVVDQGGPVKSRGFEFEVSAAPARGLTLGGSLSYSNTKFEAVNPVLVSAFLGAYEPYMRPDWTGGIWGQYDSRPLGGGDAYLSLRVDANWTSKVIVTPNPYLAAYAPGGFAPNLPEIPANWILNGRVALRDLEIGGAKSELALWAKNLTNSREKGYAVNVSQVFAQANYIPARTYGVDLTIQF